MYQGTLVKSTHKVRVWCYFTSDYMSDVISLYCLGCCESQSAVKWLILSRRRLAKPWLQSAKGDFLPTSEFRFTASVCHQRVVTHTYTAFKTDRRYSACTLCRTNLEYTARDLFIREEMFFKLEFPADTGFLKVKLEHFQHCFGLRNRYCWLNVM